MGESPGPTLNIYEVHRLIVSLLVKEKEGEGVSGWRGVAERKPDGTSIPD